MRSPVLCLTLAAHPPAGRRPTGPDHRLRRHAVPSHRSARKPHHLGGGGSWRPIHLLRGRGFRRPVENRGRRGELASGLRRPAGALRGRGRGCPFRPERRLGGDRRALHSRPCSTTPSNTRGFSLWREGERSGKGCSWGAGPNVEETTDMTGKTGIGLDVLTWFPPRRCGRNYDISFQYSRLRLTNREWFRGKDHMGSHIPIRQLRRSSVNARPRGATPSRSCRFCRIHKRLCHLPPSLQILCFEALPPGLQAQPWGCVR